MLRGSARINRGARKLAALALGICILGIEARPLAASDEIFSEQTLGLSGAAGYTGNKSGYSRRGALALFGAFTAGTAAPVLSFAQAPGVKIPLAVMERVVDHLRTLVSNPSQITSARFARFSDAAYWRETLRLNQVEAATVAKVVSGNLAYLARRMPQIGLEFQSLDPVGAAGFLGQQLAFNTKLAVFESAREPRERVRIFFEECLNLVFEEQQAVALAVHRYRERWFAKREGPLIQAPAGLINQPSLADAVKLIGENDPRLAKALAELVASLPRSYAPLRRRSNGRLEVALPFFDGELFGSLNAELDRYGYAFSHYSEGSPLSGVQSFRTHLFAWKSDQDITVPVEETPIRISRGVPKWTIGTTGGDRAELGGFGVLGVDHHVVLSDAAQAATLKVIGDIKAARRIDVAPNDAFSPWDPVFKTLIDRAFPEKDPTAIEDGLRWETILHELLHPWQDLKKLAPLNSKIAEIFRATGPAVVERLVSEFAAYTGALALSDRPDWQLVQWVLMLPRGPGDGTSAHEAALSDRLLRELAIRLQPHMKADLQWLIQAEGRLTRAQGIRFLKMYVAGRVPPAHVRAAARRVYSEWVGELMPKPARLLGRGGPLIAMLFESWRTVRTYLPSAEYFVANIRELSRKKAYGEAWEIAQQAIETYPCHGLVLAEAAMICAHLAKAKGDAGLREKSVHLARVALMYDRTRNGLHGPLAFVLKMAGRLDEALEESQEEIISDPRRPQPYMLRAQIFFAKWKLSSDPQDFEHAIQNARDAVQLEPGYLKSWSVLSIYLEDGGRWEEAAAVREDGLGRNPNNEGLRQVLVNLYGRWIRALEDSGLTEAADDVRSRRSRLLARLARLARRSA